MMERKCGDCQLCCKLLPTKEIGKVANTRCEHQRTGKGCTIYARRPFSCSSWSCRWLLEDDTADLSRPDRAHYPRRHAPPGETLRPTAVARDRRTPITNRWRG